VTWYGASTPPGYSAYWYGTKNGSPDVNGLFAGVTNFNFNATYDASQIGNYTRYLQIRNGATVVCTTNTINTNVHN
jgi:hypothetical protein